MYLKEIVAVGFKSFADKMDIQLDNEITCIVGPNGSGKSNVVDAVRWVLGEQSVKSLRGDGTMSDVIFSGSKSRKALNVASVELVFDNRDHYLNFDFSEVSIKRKAYRSGENEYFLNHQKCRLKDIVNLLLDTGIGKESFNIISQGEVDKILSHSSGDRRVIIEEAAEVLKYKKRKEEALKKLDKTHDNLSRINDIIGELEGQVEPLRRQSIKAKEYLDNQEKLEKLEVALLSYDIYHDSESVKILVEKRDKLEEKIMDISNTSSNRDVKILEDNHRLDQLQNTLSDKNKRLLEITEEVEKINSERLLLKEKNKNHSSQNAQKSELKKLVEEQAKIEADIHLISEEIEAVQNSIKQKNTELSQLDSSKNRMQQKKKLLHNEYSKIDQEIITLRNKMNVIRHELDELSYLPRVIKQVLSCKKLTGIHQTIGNVIDVDEEFAKALEVSIQSCKNFIITDCEEDSKKAIQYLKEEKLGRATFFPLNIIEPRRVDSHCLTAIQHDQDFICVLSDIVRCDKKYNHIIQNQLGQILVSPDIDCARRLSKKINRHYRIVTLDGDVIHVGGSMTGGDSKNYHNQSSITLKQELNFLKENIFNKEVEKGNIQEEMDQLNTEINKIDEEYFKFTLEKASLNELLGVKNSNYHNFNQKLENILREVNSLKQIVNDTFIDHEKLLLDQYYEKCNIKEKIISDIQALSEEVDALKKNVDEAEALSRLKNSEIRTLEKEKNELDIQINRLEIRLDSMLNTLNEEYSLTFEKARKEYSLEEDSESARSKVSLYKSNIKKLGMVNLESIEEFERVNTRYEFLCSQKDDLLIAENSLLEIMQEMDGVIEQEFMRVYQLVNQEFSTVFKELFGGGSACLALTDPEHILTTGIDIEASPPGKKLSSISLLSGGEKTLTAISLLFAILNVKSVPFCLFDEVEAALDEANVETFGKYLAHYKNKTQFLIITHKKKTMEYADTLYGITMQESGVSKLVSVQLNEHVDTL